MHMIGTSLGYDIRTNDPLREIAVCVPHALTENSNCFPLFYESSFSELGIKGVCAACTVVPSASGMTSSVRAFSRVFVIRFGRTQGVTHGEFMGREHTSGRYPARWGESLPSTW